jgi:hypothetical protein
MRPMTALVVDDLADVRAVVAELLSHAGYQVLTAGSLADAEAVRARLGLAALGLVITNLRLTRTPEAREGVPADAGAWYDAGGRPGVTPPRRPASSSCGSRGRATGRSPKRWVAPRGPWPPAPPRSWPRGKFSRGHGGQLPPAESHCPAGWYPPPANHPQSPPARHPHPHPHPTRTHPREHIKQWTVRLSQALIEAVKAQATAEGKEPSHLVEEVLWAGLTPRMRPEDPG